MKYTTENIAKILVEEAGKDTAIKIVDRLRKLDGNKLFKTNVKSLFRKVWNWI